MVRKIRGSGLAAASALFVVAAACNDSQGPQGPRLEGWGQPPPQTGELSGVGEIMPPGGDMISFAFDVKSDQTGITGTFAGTDLSNGATLTTDPAGNPATFFIAFRSSSSFCAVSSHGAEFDAQGVLVESGVPSTVTYTVKACDNGTLGSMDTFDVIIPSHGFEESGTVTGDIVKQ